MLILFNELLKSRIRRVGFVANEAEHGLQDSDVVVTAGRGIKKAQNVPLVRSLADALGAALGASRDVVDRGWLSYPHQVGLSGKTEFPHLHLLVEKDGKSLDPFVGPGGGEACAPGAAPLWQPAALALLAYQGAALYNAGFADEAPLGENIIEGRYRRASFPQDAPALVFWMEAFGVRAGDRLRVRLEGPSGTVAENDEVLTKDQARRWAFVGRKRPGAGWPAGRYRGEAILRRETPSGPASWRISRSVSVR